MEQLTLVAPTLFGLEGVCAEELKRLDARNVRAENGRTIRPRAWSGPICVCGRGSG